MSRKFAIAFAMFACSCGASSLPSTQPSKIGSLAYEVPGEWGHDDSVWRLRTTMEWTPPDNDRKESITLIRNTVSPALVKAGLPAIESQLVDAQSALRTSRVSAPMRFTTPHGLVGVRLETDFTPPGASRSYHRVHAVVLDGDAVVHVLYTAASPDADLTSFDLVLATLRRGEA